MANCICTQYINKHGFGNCAKLDLKNHIFNGKKICYVDLPSKCPDLRRSFTNKGKKLSSKACEYDQERSLRERLGISNSLTGIFLS